MNTSEIEIATRTVAQRLNKSLEEIERTVQEFEKIGLRLTKPMTHNDIQFTPRRNTFSVLEGDK